jgi:lipid II isoglutaminyl synthase (glutamine-hydrolysing)
MKPQFFITHLYPEEMSIYGDMGNIIAMRYRLEKYGFEVVYQTVGQGQDLPETTDWYFMGGGQDKEQEVIYKDLLQKKNKLIEDIENGVGLLAICGGYQLLGKQFITGNGVEVEGIGVFDVVTKAPGNSVKQRCIGNIIEECLIDELKGIKLVGFENHGGQTEFVGSSESVAEQKMDDFKHSVAIGAGIGAGLETGITQGLGGYIGMRKFQNAVRKQVYEGKCQPLGKVLKGFGNTYNSGYEGCVYKHAVGTYLHGSCLPKNPKLADWFINKVIVRKGLDVDLPKIDDTISEKTRGYLVQRFG